MNLVRNRRTFVGLVIVATVSGLVGACGVKGPLYLPEEPEPETEKEKAKDEEKTSRRSPAPEHAVHG